MGTKLEPGQFDCYASAEADEPTFTLLGRDPVACLTVLFWVKIRAMIGGTDEAKLVEARKCARDMEKYLRSKHPEKFERYKKALTLWNQMFGEAGG